MSLEARRALKMAEMTRLIGIFRTDTPVLVSQSWTELVRESSRIRDERSKPSGKSPLPSGFVAEPPLVSGIR